MDDQLKKFIADKREEFDVFEPRPDLWQDISKELHPTQSKSKPAKVVTFRVQEVLRYAAAIALIFLSAFLLGRYMKQSNEVQLAGESVKGQTAIETIAPELLQVEAHYTSLIEQKQAELNEFDLKALEVDSDLDAQMKTLDSTYAQLKKELLSSPNKDQVIDAMTVNMQLRIDLLNQQLNTLKKIKKQQSTYKDESIHI